MLGILERIFIMEIMSIRHMTRSKEWMMSLKLILNLNLNTTKTVIIFLLWSKDKTLTVEMMDLK